jgi:hypothetical protein
MTTQTTTLDTKVKRPSADPVPWVTRKYTRPGALPFDPTATDGGEEWTHTAKVLTDVVATMVTGWHDDVVPYRVRFGKHRTGSTDLTAKDVLLGTRPLTAKGLTIGQRAAILTGLVYHEVGHIRYSRPFAQAFADAWRPFHPERDIAHLVANYGDDVVIERKMARDLPGFAPCLPVLAWWMGQEQREAAADPRVLDPTTLKGRTNIMLAAIRFPWLVDWDARGWRTEGTWWTDWVERHALASDGVAYVASVADALDHLKADLPVQPPEPKGDDGEGKPEDGEPGDGETKGRGDSTEGETKGDAQGEKADGESDSQDGSDASDGDADGEPGDETSDAQSGASEAPTGSEGKPDGGDTEGKPETEPEERVITGPNLSTEPQSAGDATTPLLGGCPIEFVYDDEGLAESLDVYVETVRRRAQRMGKVRIYQGPSNNPAARPGATIGYTVRDVTPEGKKVTR